MSAASIRHPALPAMLLLAVTGVAAATAPAAPPAPASPGTPSARQQVVDIVEKIRRADYENDRPALKQLHAELAPFVQDEQFGSRVRYWRGFALWRKAQNAMNESVDPKEIEQDLALALEEFQQAAGADPKFIDARAGAISCVGNTMYLNRENQTRLQELVTQVRPLIQEARAAAPDHPRLLWVLGPNLWNTPPERGGGQDRAIESYLAALETWRRQKGTVTDPLEPVWGEPELYMSLSWSYLNRATPDLEAAEKYALLALQLVPYWHYTRDILLPQIHEAKAKHN